MNTKNNLKMKLTIIGIGILILIIMSIYDTIREHTSDKEKAAPEDTVVAEEITLQNVWVISGDKEGIQIFYDGSTLELKGNFEEDIAENILADITYIEDRVTSLRLKADCIYGKILSVKEDAIEIAGYGVLSMDSNTRFLQTSGKLTQLQYTDIYVGYEGAQIFVAEGKVSGVVMNQIYSPQAIRVLIKTNDFADIYHNEIILTSTSDYVIGYGENEEQHPASESITITMDSPYFADGRIKISSISDAGEIQIQSLNRACGAPSYLGVMEIEKTENGLLLVNELSIEQYLYSVVPSEMPTTYGIEALKAQAICARSYATRQIFNNQCAQYGAHVDDSVQYQVYNNLARDEIAIQAVNDTAGMVVTYGGEVAQTYYFSTSCGHTSSDQVWDVDEENTLCYLKSVMLQDEQEELDLTNEEVFAAFIKNKGYPSYDSSINWYRWEVDLSLSQIANSINTNLYTRWSASSGNILVRNENNEFEDKEIATIGDVLSITVEKRGTGGAIESLIIEGTTACIKVKSEYNIRALLSPSESIITKNDGTTAERLSILPSAYFLIEPIQEADVLTGFHITGGGYGHGVGMSQNGANNMALAGKTYEEILNFFYKDIEIVVQNLERLK